ncbi:MAG TPA: MBL fold metallo-hydrolase [Egibacteraceae bacterium]|nr:MBL fold metallo-hydrolase [Egibacteraceae bacterium]
MYLKQFHEPALGHASYLLGDEATGKALVVDPRRDVGEYFGVARAQGMRIAYAMDTHGHNDYLSGLSEIAARADVTVLGYAEADLGYDHRQVTDKEVVEFGDVAIEVVHTPGHTPEHVSLLAYDREAGDEPALLLSGGALLVGDLARPDLLGGRDEARAAAATFCRTLQERILSLPDHVEVFPTHVAGSLCGGNIGSRLSTTVGYERRTNEVLARLDATEALVDDCLELDVLPAVPPYWRRMRAQNLAGVALLGVLREPPALQPEEVRRAVDDGAVVLDTRSPEAFGAAHIPGALNAGLGSSFPTWAGTVLDADAQVVAVLDEPERLWEVVWHLLRIGYDVPVGWLAGGMRAWRTRALPFAQIPQISVHGLHQQLERGEVAVVDVRQPAEWAGGHIDGATFITGGELPARLAEVPADRPVAVVCGSGFRSSVAASLLSARAGVEVRNVLGGMAAWTAAGYPTTQ